VAVVLAAASLIWLAALRTGTRALLLARHAGEIASIVKAAPSSGRAITVRRTSRTVGLSAQVLENPADGQAVLYSISRSDRRLTQEEAASVAQLIGNLASPGETHQALFRGGHDVYHLVIRPAPGPVPASAAKTTGPANAVA
jgi:hypothetical protein